MIGYRGRSGGWFGKVKWLVAAMIFGWLKLSSKYYTTMQTTN